MNTSFIRISLTANTGQAIAAFAEAEAAINRFDNAVAASQVKLKTGNAAFAQMGHQTFSLGKKTMAMGAIMAGAFALAIKSAGDFEEKMKNVQSISGASDKVTKIQSTQVLELSTQTPQSAEDLASALYQIQSAGFKGAEGLKILKDAAQGATAGLGETEDTTKIILSVLKAYNLEASKSGDIMDTVFASIKSGLMRLPDVQKSIQPWLTIAAKLKIPFEEAMASLATLTLQGIVPRSAGTYLSRAIESAFTKPNADMIAAQKKLGFNKPEEILHAKGFVGALEAIAHTTDGTAQSLSRLFKTIQAARAVLGIVNNNSQVIKDIGPGIVDPAKRAGEAQRAFEVQMGGFNNRMKVMANTFKKFMIDIGSAFLPVLGAIALALTQVASALNSLPQPVKTALGAFLLFGGAMKLATGALAVFRGGALLTKVAMQNLAEAEMGVTVASSLGTASTAATSLTGRLGAAALAAKASSGVISGSMAAASAGMTGLGSAVAALATGPVGIAVLGTVAVASMFQLTSGLRDADKEGKKLADTFADGLKTDTFDGMRSSVARLEEQLAKSNDRLKELGTTANQGISLADVGSVVNPFDGTSIEQDKSRERSTNNQLKERRDLAKQKVDDARAFVLAANLQRQGVNFAVNSSAVRDAKSEDKMIKKRAKEDGSLATESARRKAQTPISIEQIKSGQAQGPQISKLMKATGPVRVMQPLELLSDKSAGPRAKTTLANILKGVSTDAKAQLDQLGSRMSRLAESHGIDFDKLMKSPDTHPKMVQALMGEAEALDKLAPKAQDTAIAWNEMGKAAKNTSSKVEQLNKALHAELDMKFGAETAKDDFESLITTLNKGVTEIKSSGSLKDAMNFNSFSEDAISTRKDMLDITSSIVDETTAWTKQQVNATPDEINQHMQKGITLFQNYGKEMGLSTDFVKHYTDSIQAIINENVITTKFENNAPDSAAAADNYLLTILKTPAVVETTAKLYDTQGKQQVLDWLRFIGINDEQTISAIIHVEAEQAYKEFDTAIGNLNLKNKKDFVKKAINLAPEYKANPESDNVKKFLKEFRVKPEDAKIVFTTMGDPASKRFMDVTEMWRAAMTKEPAKIEVTGDTVAITAAENVAKALANIKDVDTSIQVTVKPIKDNTKGFWDTHDIPGITGPGSIGEYFSDLFSGGGSPSPSKPKKKQADGGVLSFYKNGGMLGTGKKEDHTAHIAPAGAWRVFAEPETGGEAYIPLAGAKRKRSMAILETVAENFGARVVPFASGGVHGGGPVGMPGQVVKSSKDSEHFRTEIKTTTLRENMGGVVNYYAQGGIFNQQPGAGLLVPGNIGGAGPTVVNALPDGHIVLLPARAPDGHNLSQREAVAQYKVTGQFYGIFDSVAHANNFAVELASASTTPAAAASAPAYANTYVKPDAPASDGSGGGGGGGDFGGLSGAGGGLEAPLDTTAGVPAASAATTPYASAFIDQTQVRSKPAPGRQINREHPNWAPGVVVKKGGKGSENPLMRDITRERVSRLPVGRAVAYQGKRYKPIRKVAGPPDPRNPADVLADQMDQEGFARDKEANRMWKFQRKSVHQGMDPTDAGKHDRIGGNIYDVTEAQHRGLTDKAYTTPRMRAIAAKQQKKKAARMVQLRKLLAVDPLPVIPEFSWEHIPEYNAAVVQMEAWASRHPALISELNVVIPAYFGPRPVAVPVNGPTARPLSESHIGMSSGGTVEFYARGGVRKLPNEQQKKQRRIPGLVKPGNVDTTSRPHFKDHKTGKPSPIRSASFKLPSGQSVLVPTVIQASPDAPVRVVSKKAAFQHYVATGENLGTFKSVKAADAYSAKLRKADEEKLHPKKNKRSQTIKHHLEGGVSAPLLSFSKGGAAAHRYDSSGIRGTHAEHRVAQIAPGGTIRVWAEPETGGEAYIPLAKSKRPKSMSVLQKVAAKFGAKVVQFDNGGYVADPGGQSLSSRSHPTSKQKKAASKKKAVAEDKTSQEVIRARMQEVQVDEFKMTQADASSSEKAAYYKKKLSSFTAYSDEWMQIAQKQKDAEKQAADDEASHDTAVYALGNTSITQRIAQLKKKSSSEKMFGTEWLGTLREIQDAQDELVAAQNKYGAIGDDEYVAYLNERLSAAEAYSPKWMEITDKIKEINDRAMSTKNKYGAVSDDDYLTYLKNRLAGTRAFSAEWVDVTEQIKTIQTKQDNVLESKHSSKLTSDAEYVSVLKVRLKATQQFSDEWFTLFDKIAAAEKAGLERTTDLYSKFNNRTMVGTNSVLRYLTKQVKLAKDFQTTMASLAASGQYDSATLNAVSDMGPSGLGLAKGMLGGAGKTSGASIADLLKQATSLGINTATYDRGGMLMPGITLAYNGTGSPEHVVKSGEVSSSSGPIVEIQNYNAYDATDVQMLGSKVGFAVRSARM